MKKTSRTILAIETSCDDTAIALVKCGGTLKSPKFEVLENIVSSQIAIHRPFGGVVPNLAKREHLKNLPEIFKNLKLKTNTLKLIDYVAVTVGPGLEPALWAGINFAQKLEADLRGSKRGLTQTKNPQLIGVNHMEGHLYSAWLPSAEVQSSKLKVESPKKILNPSTLNLTPKIQFPAIALIVSGGHTILLRMTAINKWTKLGETLDDAAGEAFDKVARMLELPYPGGPEIQKLAAKGNPNAIKFPRPMLNKPGYEFSFSGLKTSVLYYIRDHGSQINTDSYADRRGKTVSVNPRLDQRKSALAADVAASFQQAVIDCLVKKTMRAAEEFNAKSILLCGGVSANKPLQESLKVESRKSKVKFICPDFQFNTDNAAMIAAAAYISSLQKNKKPLPMEAQGNLTI